MQEIAKCDWYGSSTVSPTEPLFIGMHIAKRSRPHTAPAGVAGGTASGKSSVCKAIIESLKNNVLVRCRGRVYAKHTRSQDNQRILSLTLDCYYKDLPPAFTGDPFNDYNFDHPDAFDWEALVETLTALKQGQPTNIPQYGASCDLTACQLHTTHRLQGMRSKPRNHRHRWRKRHLV